MFLMCIYFIKKYVILDMVIKMAQKNKRGRPKGKFKDNRLNIMIPTSVKNEFQLVAQKQGTNISVKTCELIIDYINKNKEYVKDENERN